MILHGDITRVVPAHASDGLGLPVQILQLTASRAQADVNVTYLKYP